ncbi:MAG TPA: hypothetical protein VI814_01175 [Candidatus Limnocylindria bacterium]
MNVHMPTPTVWPAALATGVTLVAAGLITSPLLLVFGGILMAAAFVGWVSILTSEESHGGEEAHR